MAPPGATARWRAPWLFCWALRQHDIGPTRAGVPRTGWKPKIWTPHAAAVLAVRCLVHERCNYNLDYDLGDLTDTGAAVVVTTFRPSENQAVLVVAAADTDAVEARLRPQLGELLCVVASKWTRAVFDAVRAHLDERWERWNLYELGETSSQHGQAHIEAKLTMVLPEIAEWAASLPPGIVALDPWLHHAGPQPSDL